MRGEGEAPLCRLRSPAHVMHPSTARFCFEFVCCLSFVFAAIRSDFEVRTYSYVLRIHSVFVSKITTMASGSGRKRQCTFTEVMKTKYSFLKEGKEPTEAYCMICDCSLSIKHKGITDIETHVNSNKHKTKLTTVNINRKVTDSFASSSSLGSKQKQSAAEGTLAFHTVKHHQSYNSMECTRRLMKVIFPDSNIASEMTCSRTKTEAIINGVISPWVVKNLTISLKNIDILRVSTDASNHGSEKIFPIMIQYFDCENGGIQTKLLDIHSTRNEASETIAEIIMTTLQKYDLSEKCISFTADNANVNFGGINRPLSGRNVLTINS